jgi:uncharacterized protein (TIGR03000 family)
MYRNLQKFMLASIAALAVFSAELPQAQAFWWRHGGSSGGSSGGWGSSGGSSGGSYGGWGSSGGSSGGYGYGYTGWGSSGGSSGGYGSSGGSSGGWGSSGGSYGGRHHHARRYASYGSWGSSYGGGGWGSSGGSSGGYSSGWGSSGGSSGGYAGGSSGGSVGGYSGYTTIDGGIYSGSTVVDGGVINGGTVIDSNMPVDGTYAPGGAAPGPVMAPPAGAPAVAPAPGPDKGASLNSAILNVRVPPEAKIFVNGLATSSTGTARRYVSNGLQSGYSYTYELRAELTRDGKTVSETKVVKLKAGDASNLDFTLEGEQQERVATEPARTSLTLLVPADAKVYLSGNPTQSSGEVREFSTTKLAGGAEWKDYAVRVELERDGQILTQEKTVSLRAGESKELKISFDAPEVARTASNDR